jgi:hypothetical protein
LDGCEGNEVSSPSAQELFDAGFISKGFYRRLASELHVSRSSAQAPFNECFPGGAFSNTAYGYDIILESLHSPDLEIASLKSCAEGQSPRYCDLRITTSRSVQTSTPREQAITNAILRIWFPFVLPERTYVLQISQGGSLKAVPGVLRDNELTFKLPDMKVTDDTPIGAVVTGE